MLPEEAARLVDAILEGPFRESERRWNEDVRDRLDLLQMNGAIGGSRHYQLVLEAFERDLERRARAIEAALRRILILGLAGHAEAVGETLCAAFRDRFERQTQKVEAHLPMAGNLQNLTLGGLPQHLSATICGELRLAAMEYVQSVRPPLPAIDLLPEQEQLLMVLVEASRSVPLEAKRAFLLLHVHNRKSGRLVHPGMDGKPEDAYAGDIEELGRKGLLGLMGSGRSDLTFDVRPEGFRYYEELRRKQGTGFDRVQQVPRSLLDSGRFRQLYPMAFERWSHAETLLWQPDIEAKLTTVGHILREGFSSLQRPWWIGFHLPMCPRTLQRIKPE